MKITVEINEDAERETIAGLDRLVEEGVLKRLESPSHAWDAGRVYYLARHYPHFGSVTRALATVDGGRIAWGDANPARALESMMHVYNQKNAQAASSEY